MISMGNDTEIGKATCPNCGIVSITDINNLKIKYPKGPKAGPTAVLKCEKCQLSFQAPLKWVHALTFDFQGADCEPFSFARGAVITEEEIVSFMENFKKEMERFLDEDN